MQSEIKSHSENEVGKIELTILGTDTNVTSTLDHVLTTSLPRSKNSRTWRGRGQNETNSDI